MRNNRIMAAVLVAGLPLAAAACTGTGSGGSSSGSAQGVDTSSTFTFASGTPGIVALQQPLDITELAADTSWSESARITDGTSDVATSDIALQGGTLNADGTESAELVWTVTGSGTSNIGSGLIPDPVTGADDVSCSSNSIDSQCTEPLTIPAASAASPDDAEVALDEISPSSTSGTNLWAASLVIGSTQWVVGFIGIPGTSVSVDTTAGIVNQTSYTGSATTCATTPTSTVEWLSPTDTTTGNAAQYSSSAITSGTCPATFTAESPGGGVTGVTVLAPTGGG